jgi:hypothetical protein
MIIQGGVVLCACGENAARYINARGELCCSLCPLKQSIDSIKLDDVPKLLAWARLVVDMSQQGGIEHPRLTYRMLGELIDIVQRRPGHTPPVLDDAQLLRRLDDEIAQLESELGLKYALREVTRTGKGYPPADPAADEDVRDEEETPKPIQLDAAALAHEAKLAADEEVRCCCHRPGWLGPHHDDPHCEYRDRDRVPRGYEYDGTDYG